MLAVLDRGARLEFGFDDLMRYHGPSSPGGVAHADKVLELALPLLGDPPERREVEVATAFGGPGARDGFELVLRAVTEGRYAVGPGLARPARGWTRQRFVFRLPRPRRAGGPASASCSGSPAAGARSSWACARGSSARSS